MRAFLIVIAAAVVMSVASTASADVQLTIQNGRVTLVAKDATVRQILAEWARVGQTQDRQRRPHPRRTGNARIARRLGAAGLEGAAALARRIRDGAASDRGRRCIGVRSHSRDAGHARRRQAPHRPRRQRPSRPSSRRRFSRRSFSRSCPRTTTATTRPRKRRSRAIEDLCSCSRRLHGVNQPQQPGPQPAAREATGGFLPWCADDNRASWRFGPRHDRAGSTASARSAGAPGTAAGSARIPRATASRPVNGLRRHARLSSRMRVNGDLRTTTHTKPSRTRQAQRFGSAVTSPPSRFFRE